VEPLEGAEQKRGLGLDAFDRRDDQDRAIEDTQDALDLGDEVGMAGRVDQVDREIADQERGDSVWVVPASTLPTRSMAPAEKRSRSVRVVLPASTCARMPRLSVRMGPHAFQGGDHLLAGHECSHGTPFS